MTDLTDMTAVNDLSRIDPFSSSGLIPGFDDPVAGAQSTFRTLLDALSHPGRAMTLDEVIASTGTPTTLSVAMTAMLLTLVDSDTPLWLPPNIDEATRQFLRFHCACPFATSPADAHFVAVPAGFAVPALNSCAQGDPAYPDRSTTLLIEVTDLRSIDTSDVAHTQASDHAEANATSTVTSSMSSIVPAVVPSVVPSPETAAVTATVTLTGPGIEHAQRVVIDGLPGDFWSQWRRQRQSFPLGVEVFFCRDATLCGLPRTTRVEN